MRKVIVGNDKVFIGRLGDDDVREFAFDLSEYVSCMDGEFSVSCLFVLPSKSDSEAYAIAIDHYRLEGNQLIWIPTNAECSETGWGKFEAILYNDGQQVASLIWRVQVGKSLVGDEEPPEGWENYILAVERLVDSAEAAADRIADMSATASVDTNTGTPSVTVTKTEDPLVLNFSFHNLKGAKGDKGDTGSKGETGNGIVSIVKTGTSGLVDTYTITYDNGDTDTFTVTNGEKGDKGDTGATGATPDIYTTAVTLAEGSSAYAHVSGTIEQPLVTFGIPKGDKGDKGDKGNTGDGWTAAQSAKLDALPSLAGTDGKFVVEEGEGHMYLAPYKYTYQFTGDVVYNMVSHTFSATLIDGSYSTFMTAFSSGEVDSALFFATIYVDVDGDDIGDTMVGYMLFNITGASTSLNFTTLFDGRDLGFAQVCYVQLNIDSADTCNVIVRNVAQKPHQMTISEASANVVASTDYESIHFVLTNTALSDITIYDYDCPLYDIVFTTGATAPTLSIGSGRPIYFPDGTVPTLEPNTRYEINVKDTYAVVASWT